jgi:ATP-dependent DNA helicase PIF1
MADGRMRSSCFIILSLYLFIQTSWWSRIKVESFATTTSTASVSRPSHRFGSTKTMTMTIHLSTRSAPSTSFSTSSSMMDGEHTQFDEYNENDEYDDGILEEEVSYGSSSHDRQEEEAVAIQDERTARGGTSVRISPSDGTTTSLTMSEEQEQALEYIRRGENVFVTGVAGTGKSMVLKAALDYLSNALRPNQYVAVAPTGAAAVAVEGQTIHSFASIGIPKTYKDFEKSKRNKATAKHWRALKVLVIDEVSMVSGEFFDLLSAVVSDIRNDPRPFGGIQLVVCGDFLQLSPIAPPKAEVSQIIEGMMEGRQHDPEEEGRIKDLLFLNRGFCFQSLAWKEAQFKVMELETVFRQHNREFIDALQDIRKGRVTQQTMNYLRQNCERPLPPIDEYGIRPTLLHSTNVNVNRENLVDLNRLPGETIVYKAIDEVEVEKGVGKWAVKPLQNSQFFRTCIAEGELQLKVNAQVMLIKNLNQGSKLVNGSRGTVVGFRTINASPNSKKAETLHLLPGVDRYPVVQFVNGLRQVVTPQKFQSRLVGMGACTRTAIPLKLAWAITTHKAQGLTLDFVIADVGQVFAEAQLYVALSRASDAKGLELRNFSKNRVRANPLAIMFYEDPMQDLPYWWEVDGRGRSDLPPSMKTFLTDQHNPKSRSKKKKNKKTKEHKKQKIQNVDSDDVLRSGRTKKSGKSVRGGTSQDRSTIPPSSSSSMLAGKVFVFVGNLEGVSNEDAETAVQRHGGSVRHSVSTKTDFLVLGRFLKNGKPSKSGAQYKKATEIIEKQKTAHEVTKKGGGKFTGLRILKEESFTKVLFK